MTLATNNEQAATSQEEQIALDVSEDNNDTNVALLTENSGEQSDKADVIIVPTQGCPKP